MVFQVFCLAVNTAAHDGWHRFAEFFFEHLIQSVFNSTLPE